PNGQTYCQIFLLDTGELKLYKTVASSIVVAPSVVGITSPEPESTPDYYVRGRYPAWFQLYEEIVQTEIDNLSVLERPTLGKADDCQDSREGHSSLEELDQEKA